jgi:hypothetical protein
VRGLGTTYGLQRVQGRALVRGPGGLNPPGSSGGLRNYRHLFEMLLTFNKNYLLIKLQREVTQVAMLTNYKNGPILIFITQIK